MLCKQYWRYLAKKYLFIRRQRQRQLCGVCVFCWTKQKRARIISTRHKIQKKMKKKKCEIFWTYIRINKYVQKGPPQRNLFKMHVIQRYVRRTDSESEICIDFSHTDRPTNTHTHNRRKKKNPRLKNSRIKKESQTKYFLPIKKARTMENTNTVYGFCCCCYCLRFALFLFANILRVAHRSDDS